jgi:hypothetical protein
MRSQLFSYSSQHKHRFAAPRKGARDSSHRASRAGDSGGKASCRCEGSFIAAGGVFDAFQAVGKVLATAASDVLIVDAYGGHEVLDYALATPELVKLRVLADRARYQKSLKPAGEKWSAQFGASRPLELRLTAPKTLHDRLIIVDQKAVWSVGQSFNALATRVHTSISRLEPEIASQKLDAYATMWNSASPL